MAIEEKLFKSLELLRITSEYSGDVCQRNKEKIQNCTYVTDTLTNPTTRTLPNFHHLLTSSFEILFQMCNDIESDVRLVAEESLNKIIKAMDNENTNKVLMELHKEIKRNGPARSLKSALWRFSILAGLIRLPKRKQYLISLIPCIVSISERSEDLTHEALMNSLPKILKSLGSFLSDSDVKTLLNTFLNNVGDSSTVIRRASANCLLTICINCRKPYQFLSYLLDTLLELLMPTAGTMVSVFLVVGVLSCLRMLIPHIRKIEGRQEIQGSFGITKKTKVIQVGEEKFVQVYRLCVHFLLCDDDSVMSAALDTLSSLFQNCTREFKNLLLSGNGIGVGDGRYYLPAQLYNANNVTRVISKPALPEESRKQNDTATFSSPPEESAAEEDVELHKKDGMNLIRVRNVKELFRNDEILDIGSPHDKEVALIFCTRLVCRLCLLSGRRFGMIPDNAVRISVKSSALASLASLFAIYPQSFLLYLSKNRPPSDEIDDRQPISDIMLLTNHSDPQLRGAIRLVIASYLKSAFLEAGTAASYDDWLSSITDTSLPNEFNSNRLLAFIKEGLLDVSSNCVRQSLTGLITCMNYVLLSSDCRLVLALLEQIPVILQGAHWLVKAKILEVIEQLPFPLIHSMGAEENFRDRLVFDVVFGLLADEDQRVRTIAAKTVVRIVPLLFYSEGRKSAERVVVEHTHMYFHDGRLSKTAGKERDSMEEEEEKEGEEKEKEGMSEEEKIQVKIFCDDLPFPFDTLFDTAPEENRNVRDALSMIVSALCRRLERNFASDSTIAGYVEALSLLSSSYPTTTYKEIWGVDESCQMNLLSFVGCLLDNELIYDIDCHTYVLRLYGNLFAGMCVHMLRTKDIDDITTATPLTPTAAATATVQRLLWRKFSEKRQQEICESFLNHTLKLLNIFVHIIEDTSLTELKPPSANSNSTASSGGSSPLKTAKKVIGGDLERANSVNERKADDDEKTDKKNESTTTAKAVGMGYFANSAYYVKIYHGLRIAYLKYKATLNYDDQPDNIVTLLGVLLKSLGQILEIATIVETSRIAEELLSYLQTVFYLEPTCAISCVHQLLKSLFGSNLISRTDALKLLKQTAINIDENATDGSLHYALSQFHYNDLSRYLEVLRCRFRTNRRSDTPPMTWLTYTHRKEKRQAPVKPDKMLANYIRLFEPMVIRSLKDYTITSNVDVQCAVLRLLNQLVRLKVNYCLLDSEQVFIKFIQKQFEYIEEGLMAHPEKIIPKMFEFLMNLSHGKQHSKSIIGVPKVIHLCDGLMASGQAPLAYCIPALRPIVENIFLLARHHDYAVAGTAVAAADHSELEITREVLMSMLLRLFEYAEVMDLLRAILEGTKRAESRQPMEKWLKYSKQMFDVFFAKLTDDKLRLDNRNDTLALMRWLIVLHPITFSLPTVGERLVTILFRKLPGKMDNFNIISRWLGKITIILTIIVQLKKDALLKAIRYSLKNFSSEGIFDGVCSVRSDPLNVTNVENDFESIDAATIFLKFTFRALELVAGRCALAIRQDEDVPFLIEQLSHFLFVCSRIYRPEHCFATVTSLIADANSRSDDDDQSSITLEPINANFLVIGRSFPFVVYQWCCLLASLGCNPARAWIRKFMVSEAGNGDYGSSQNHHPRGRRRLPLNRLNSAVSTSSALISLSEYLIEKDERLEELSMFIEDDNLLRLAMRHCDEPPVAEVLLSVQRDPIISALFFERIRTTVQQHRLDPNVTIKLLDVLQDCHRTQTGSLIRLLIEYILKCRHLAVLRTIVNLSCRKLEYLLTFDVADIRRQISEEDLRLLTDRLVKNKLVGKNETLLGLLSKLSVHIGNGSTLEHHRQRRIDVSLVKNLEIDRTWYLKQLAASNAYVCNTSSSLNLAEVFGRINVENVANIVDQSCRKFILRSFLALVSLGTNEDDNHQTMTNEQSSLLQLAVREAFGDLVCFLKTFPRYHQVYIPENRTLYPQEETYANELDAVFRNGDNETWQRDFIELTASVENITRSFRRIDQFDEKSTLNLSLVVRFCVICAESLVYRLFNDDDDDLNVEQVESILRRLDVILKLPELIRILALDAHWTWLCSLVNSLYILFEFLTPNSAYHNQLPKFDISDIADMKNTIVQHCYDQFETVFLNVSKEWSSMKIPRTFREAITSILINLSKIPALNSYLLTPTALWKQSRTSVMMKQDAEVDDVDHLQQPAPLPIDFLKDFQLLEEYNFRISRLGWSSRKQFEETWMSLLSVLNSGLIEENDAVPSTNSFAIKTATALLGRTLYNQSNGNESSTIFHVSRDPPIKETDTSVKKLKSIQDKFERWLRTATANFTCNTPSNIVMNVFNKPNIEKLHPNTYSCGQISIAYLSLPSKASTEGADDDEDNDTDDILGRMYRERRATLLESNLDLNSCIQSLLDLYSQWFRSFENRPQSAKILNEILKSIVVISDLFQHRSQFQWMLDICAEYAKNPLLENDILYRYIIVGVCKATAVLNPDMEVYELVKKILYQYAKSPNVSVRISCLHGLLYLLEGCVLSNTVIGGLSDELQLVLPIAIEYIDEFQKNASAGTNKFCNQEHDLTVWALTFFIIENVHEDHLPLGFTDSAILSLLSCLRKSKQITMDVYSCLIKALERLIIKRCLAEDSRELILKLAIEKTKDGHAMQSLIAVQLMISCMYTDYTDRRRNSGNSDAYSNDNPDNLVHIVEKISIIFDRIKKGLPFQVEVLCHVLPDVINDFFSPADILTKVVGEYLSPQQKYPALLSHIVFEVFENGIAQSQIPLLQDWVVVSLPNFIETFSAGMATWYLTCFFVSTSTNFWLRAIFPRVRTRIGRLEHEDRLMLCIAGRDFYNNLTTDKQRQIFVDAFRRAKEEGGEPDSPFSDLLECL